MNPNPILFHIFIGDKVRAVPKWASVVLSTTTVGFKRSVDNPLELEYSMIYYEGCWTMTGFRAEMIDPIIDFAKESNIVIEHEHGKIIFQSEEDLFWVMMRFA